MFLKKNHNVKAILISDYFYFLVDCVWTEWSGCSTSCNEGIQTRSVDIEAENGGAQCTGSNRKKCNEGKCPSK